MNEIELTLIPYTEPRKPIIFHRTNGKSFTLGDVVYNIPKIDCSNLPCNEVILEAYSKLLERF